MSEPSLGEAGGLLAGAIALAAAVGKGVQWLLQWGERRAERTASVREAKLARWHSELEERDRRIEGKEDGYLAKVERAMQSFQQQLDQRSAENQALRLAFELVAGALRERDPMNSALKRAEQLLATAFPLDPIIPPTMAAELGAIDVADRS
ncbi:hypothetical protein [Sphingomonas jatrophae]|uniref:Uncharacterized protein n=1 Tax=Sphingomonas jatrophae TaxID=1166337 RepID=A0A1I6K541_9SPHN|nr:hypothetical protein [Sphingomonas jatrophae]SFR86361.1 hypothetical protein SAMN05192580_1340 [Sphingomonas jatrophae]